jgi:hypothetical protein
MKMLQIFGGMILGSIISLLLMGGDAAAAQILSHIQQVYLHQVSQLDNRTTLQLLGMTSIFLGILCLGILWLWPTTPALEPKLLSRRLRRYGD